MVDLLPQVYIKMHIDKEGSLRQRRSLDVSRVPVGVCGVTSASLMPVNPPGIRYLDVTSRQALLSFPAELSKMLGTTRL